MNLCAPGDPQKGPQTQIRCMIRSHRTAGASKNSIPLFAALGVQTPSVFFRWRENLEGGQGAARVRAVLVFD
jgi:hypothetical protein